MRRKTGKGAAILNSKKRDEFWGIVFFALSILTFVSLISYDQNDLAFYTSSPNVRVRNFAGMIGAYLAGGLVFLVGTSSFIVPLLVLTWALSKFWGKTAQRLYIKFIGTVILFVAASSLLSIVSSGDVSDHFQRGGVVGFFTSGYLLRYFGLTGTYVVLATLVLLSLVIATEFLVFPFVVFLINCAGRFFVFLYTATILKVIESLRHRPVIRDRRLRERIEGPKIILPKPDIKSEGKQTPQREVSIKEAPVADKKEKEKEKFEGKERLSIAAQKPKIQVKPQTIPPKKLVMAKAQCKTVEGYNLPTLDLLNSPPPVAERQIKDDLQKNSLILEETLRDFNIEVRVAEVERGPVITRYELEPAPGVKVTRISSLSDDIALAMKALSVRVVAPIPGKARVGIEIPNISTSLVYLQEVLGTPQFQAQAKDYKLTMALGKDVSGSPIITDLGDMPHLLIAGTTGSGKTVCVNTIITSMLYSNTPDDLRFLMIDPKRVELAVFNGLPHLLCPVVTDPHKVSAALNWVLEEMDARYRLLAKAGARNIDLYNEKTKTRQEDRKGAPDEEYDEELPAHLPYIVIIIDELADLMMTVPAEVENAITRLAQLSRAVGIHIILATQRPSVDVITGVIKANLPARISFKVATKVDSRTVLDANGADKLLGKGDMLFLKPGASKPIRGQCSLIQDEEIERIVNFTKAQRQPEYEESLEEEQRKAGSSAGGTRSGKFEKDPLYEEAVNMVLQTRQASVSMLQRRLRLSHIRAARIIDMMEEEGIVGPYQGSKPREILVERTSQATAASEEEEETRI